jgi:hypothetical protein
LYFNHEYVVASISGEAWSIVSSLTKGSFIYMSKRRHESDEHIRRHLKRKKNTQRYRNEYKSTWACLMSSCKGEDYVQFQVCGSDFSCAYGVLPDFMLLFDC